jgi:hypothetical protein
MVNTWPRDARALDRFASERDVMATCAPSAIPGAGQADAFAGARDENAPSFQIEIHVVARFVSTASR